MSKTFTLESNDRSVQILITATDVAGGVKFDLAVTEGDADMIGFYLDWDGNGGSTFGINSGNGKGKDNGANNMNGADDNGDQITGFDYAYAIGEAGLGNGDTQTASVTVTAADLGLDAFTTADLTDAIVGVRATSTTSDDLGGREGSLKLTGTCDPDEPEGPNDFPVFGQDISNVVLYWDAVDVAGGDTRPAGGDGYYTVKIDGVSGASKDLDDWIGDVLAYLVANDPNIDASSAEKLLGVAIKGGTQDTEFFAYGDNNTNGTDPDNFPGGDLDGPAIDSNELDMTYEYDAIFVG
jgi:hypothetical protein